MTTRRSFLYGCASALDRYELLVIAAASPFFIFPQSSFVCIGLLVPALWLNRLYVRGYVSVRSPLNIPVLLLLAMLGPSFLIASDHELALPKFMSVVLGIWIYMAILNLRQAGVIGLALPAISIMAIGLSLVGYTGTDWPTSGKLTLYASVYQALPKLVRVGANAYGVGINPNETGGVLAWLVPFLAAAWLGRPPGMRGFWGQVVYALLIVALLMCSVLLFLTQSRGAIFAVLASLILLGATLIRAERRVKALAITIGILVVIALIALKGPAALVDLVGSGGTSLGNNTIEVSLSSRITIWQHTAELINRYPMLGVGLAMFPIAIRPIPQIWTIGPSLPHAHNHFLQAAMDVGLPGLIAYVALLVCVFGLLLAVIRSTTPRSLAWVVIPGALRRASGPAVIRSYRCNHVCTEARFRLLDLPGVSGPYRSQVDGARVVRNMIWVQL